MATQDNSSKETILSLSKKKGDFVVQTFRCRGKGGQNVNKRDTGVRVTHPASGARGESQTYRTQFENRKEAFRRLVESQEFNTWLRLELARRGLTDPSRGQEGPTGSRGQKVRTYNAVRDEVIDHRAGTRVKGFQEVLDGKLDKLIEELQQERFKWTSEQEGNSKD